MPRPRALVRTGVTIAFTSVLAGALAGMVALAGPASAQAAPPGDHVVAQGEYLGSIAERYGTTVRALVELNQLTNPNRVRPGQRLLLPASATPPAAPAAATTATATVASTTHPPVGGVTIVEHTVERGEHLTAIADQHGTTVRAIAEANRLRNPNLVRVGTTLKVPVPVSDRLPDRLRASPERLALRPTFVRWAGEYGVPTDLLQAMCWLESGWQLDRVSPDGAVGICQFLPSTATFIAQLIGAPLDPRAAEDGIRLGARYLRYLLDRTGGDEAAALAGYVQGLRSVAERGRYGETQDYVDAVLALRERFG
jgi:LysM repeat protein